MTRENVPNFVVVLCNAREKEQKQAVGEDNLQKAAPSRSLFFFKQKIVAIQYNNIWKKKSLLYKPCGMLFANIFFS